MKTEITKIKLQLKDREIELTAREARELQAELNKLFQIEVTPPIVVTKEIHHHHSNPIWIDRYVPSWPDPWKITYGPTCETSGTLCLSLGGQLT